MMEAVTTLEEAIDRLYDLNVGVIGTGASRHERPHKPVMLLAALDLIAQGQAKPDRIYWSPDLRQRFRDYFEKVRTGNDHPAPELPFLHLRGDGFWLPRELKHDQELDLDHTPTATDAEGNNIFASLTAGFERLVNDPEKRGQVRDALVARYFPDKRSEISSLFEDGANTVPPTKPPESFHEEPEALYGRSSGFRRKVLEVYDFQCAACGLRIKLPDDDITFVDGAHLIPFSVSRNDHPTNGIALCKNHHWAMDQFLLVPTTGAIWKTSPRLDPRRSPGEGALVALNNQPILPPHDEAFRPNDVSLKWREVRLYS
jgi:putative restriction endonuclease